MRQVSECIRTIFIFAAQLQVHQKLREGLDRCDAEPSIFKAAFSLCTAVDVYGARDRGPDAPSDDMVGSVNAEFYVETSEITYPRPAFTAVKTLKSSLLNHPLGFL
jgi:hypothetical protein